MDKDKIFFRCGYFFLYPLKFLPFKALQFFGKVLGYLAYHIHTNFRKRALSNLSLAKNLKLTENELKKTAIASFQNLATACLEYSKFSSVKDLSSIVTCENPEVAYDLIKKGQGIVFFCGHQSNWEVLFLDGTLHMPGVAIGRPIKNPYLYNWVKSIRERFGGKIITPQNGIKEGFKLLKRGLFLGIVGDQALPESGYFSSFLGRKAWTSQAPALLCYKAKCPLIVATTKRKDGKYKIHYSDPIWPDLSLPIEEEVSYMMDKALSLFEKSVLDNPGEWLWQHNRWKQETPKNVYYRFRHDCMLIILPDEEKALEEIIQELSLFRAIFPLAFMSVFVPSFYKKKINLSDAEILYYENEEDLLIKDYRFKMVFNFSCYKKVKSHFLNLSAFEVFTLPDLTKCALLHFEKTTSLTFANIIKRALCRPGTLWEKTHAT